MTRVHALSENLGCFAGSKMKTTSSYMNCSCSQLPLQLTRSGRLTAGLSPSAGSKFQEGKV